MRLASYVCLRDTISIVGDLDILWGSSMDAFNTAGEALIELFIYALIIESALAIIFNWRIFKVYFDGRGIRTVIAISVSLFVVYTFDIDILSELAHEFRNMSGEPGTENSGLIITALVIAGGSGGVHRLLTVLNFRPQQLSALERRQRELAEAQADGAVNSAYVSITVERTAGIGPVMIGFEALPRTPADTRLVSGITLRNPPALKALLFGNYNRFPSFGGYAVEANKAYYIWMTAADRHGVIVEQKVYEQPLRFAKNAIVDLHTTFAPKAGTAPRAPSRETPEEVE